MPPKRKTATATPPPPPNEPMPDHPRPLATRALVHVRALQPLVQSPFDLPREVEALWQQPPLRRGETQNVTVLRRRACRHCTVLPAAVP